MNKREFFTKMAPVAKEATRKNKIKTLYNNIRMQTNKFKWSNRPVKGKDGNATTKDHTKRWLVFQGGVEPIATSIDLETSAQILNVLIGKIWERRYTS